ncbi:Transient receptor potential domain containing protein [Pleurostoma richardsiae]|uniref:Transient receptor potential domain containing protein n=1 Tax=Pleurostoma richardsiae TaxID=41990 RepID=A0AA38RSJ4_9PEZI|nr:Transient receptor potential domain containing protein [Pleurostoma richardsiae]
MARQWLGAAVVVMGLMRGALAADILKTTGFSNCGTNANVTVQRVDITYNNDNKTVTFDVVGTSNKVQNVTAVLNVTAYGASVYSNTLDPCDASTFVQQLCPVPAGTFSARGTQEIPAEYADLVPSIAFQIPDIAAMATLQLKSKDSNEDVACIQSEVTNGKTASVPAVSYVAATLAGAALVMGGVTAVGAAVAGGSAAAGGASAGGMGTISPSFVEVFGWFQGMAMNGMLSVNYPPVYRSFAKNFAFSTGLIPWTQLQRSIDDFRNATGGNLTDNSVEFLQNATLVFSDGSTQTPANSSLTKFKRAMDHFASLASRDIETSVNATDSTNTTDPDSFTQSVRTAVTGIQGYVEQLSIPSANTFMTVLLIVAIAIAAIAVGILLVKVILEFWALFGSFPKSLTGFRKHYWGSIGRAITTLILLLYGVWVLYCVFQFTHGDSWAAKTLAGVTLALFTGVLAFFSFKIWHVAHKLKRAEGDASGLYDDKDIWVKYSLFYESYRKDYWWVFVPTILYLFAKGCVLAAADGHGMAQTVAQMIIESVMLVLLLWSRPYERKSSNVINIVIQVVRVLSVVCIFVFVEEFGIAQTTQTVTGVVLIAVQSALTGILAILIVWNAVIACCKENPHRKRRKELEKMKRDTEMLTPLDARNSLLLDRKLATEGSDGADTFSISKTNLSVDTRAVPVASRDPSPDRYFAAEPANPYGSSHMRVPSNGSVSRPLTPNSPAGVAADRTPLVAGAAPLGRLESRQGFGNSLAPGGGGGGYASPQGGYGRPPMGGNGYVSPAPYGAAYTQVGYGQGGYGGGGGYASNAYGGSYRGAAPRGY